MLNREHKNADAALEAKYSFTQIDHEYVHKRAIEPETLMKTS